MDTFLTGPFLELVRLAQSLQEFCVRSDMIDVLSDEPSDTRQDIITNGAKLCGAIEVLASANGLSASIAAIRRTQSALTSACPIADIRVRFQSLIDTIVDEVSSRPLLRLSDHETRWFQTPVPFGDPVLAKFPSTQDDVIEAARCLALARYTACVFNLIRPKVQGLPTGGEKTQYLEVLAHLSSVKDARRNTTMHPERVYTEEQATRVYNNVKDFMGHLAGII